MIATVEPVPVASQGKPPRVDLEAWAADVIARPARYRATLWEAAIVAILLADLQVTR
jgi:hypothetical protein